jgi:NAD(P)-dependent dehydrogenase (short-subunit alcohol dehydrogenase family)
MKPPTPSAARRFEGQVAVVTGAGGGIGSAIAARLAAEGAQVAVCDAMETAAAAAAASIVADGGAASVLAFDLTDRGACTAAIEQVVAEHGRVDVLVNNAGVNRRGDLLSLTDADWDLTFRVNLDALFHLCRAVLPHMIAAGGGAIVNTASQWGLHPVPGHIAYNVSKAAVVSFTQNLARDYAPHGVRVNAVAPGEVYTPMVAANLERTGRTRADLDALVPFGRVGEPAEIAALVAFLASGEAPYLCGSVVEISGAQAAG